MFHWDLNMYIYENYVTTTYLKIFSEDSNCNVTIGPITGSPVAEKNRIIGGSYTEILHRLCMIISLKI